MNEEEGMSSGLKMPSVNQIRHINELCLFYSITVHG